MGSRDKRDDGDSGWFDGMADASIYGDGKYLVPGTFHLIITAIKRWESQKERGRKFWGVEFKIADLEIDHKQIEEWEYAANESVGKAKGAASQLKVGGDCSWVVDLSHESSFANIKSFCLVLLNEGTDPDEITGRVVEELCKPENDPQKQHLTGAEVICVCHYTRKKNGGTFTKHKWSVQPAAEAVA